MVEPETELYLYADSIRMVEPETELHLCATCDHIFSSKILLDKHLLTCAEKRPYVHKTSCRVFPTVRKLLQHGQTHYKHSGSEPTSIVSKPKGLTGTKVVESRACQYCFLIFRSERELTEHKKMWGRHSHSVETGNAEMTSIVSENETIDLDTTLTASEDVTFSKPEEIFVMEPVHHESQKNVGKGCNSITSGAMDFHESLSQPSILNLDRSLKRSGSELFSPESLTLERNPLICHFCCAEFNDVATMIEHGLMCHQNENSMVRCKCKPVFHVPQNNVSTGQVQPYENVPIKMRTISNPSEGGRKPQRETNTLKSQQQVINIEPRYDVIDLDSDDNTDVQILQASNTNVSAPYMQGTHHCSQCLTTFNALSEFVTHLRSHGSDQAFTISTDFPEKKVTQQVVNIKSCYDVVDLDGDDDDNYDTQILLATNTNVSTPHVQGTYHYSQRSPTFNALPEFVTYSRSHSNNQDLTTRIHLPNKKENQSGIARIHLPERKENQAGTARIHLPERKENQAGTARIHLPERKENQAGTATIHLQEKKENQSGTARIHLSERKENQAGTARIHLPERKENQSGTARIHLPERKENQAGTARIHLPERKENQSGTARIHLHEKKENQAATARIHLHEKKEDQAGNSKPRQLPPEVTSKFCETMVTSTRERQAYVCNRCLVAFDCIELFAEHRMTCLPRDYQLIKCQICDATFDSDGQLNAHYVAQHSERLKNVIRHNKPPKKQEMSKKQEVSEKPEMKKQEAPEKPEMPKKPEEDLQTSKNIPVFNTENIDHSHTVQTRVYLSQPCIAPNEETDKLTYSKEDSV